MRSTTVRISTKSRGYLKELSAQTGKKMQEIIDEAIESYRRHLFLERANASFAALQTDSKAWKDEEEERKVWEATLSDGLKA